MNKYTIKTVVSAIKPTEYFVMNNMNGTTHSKWPSYSAANTAAQDLCRMTRGW